jgi:hypothetical protein
MDIFKDISGAEDRDIIISLPKSRTWLEYLSYFMDLQLNNIFLEIVLQSVPKTTTGKKCYLVYDGFLRGFMEISKIRENENNDICIDLVPILHSTPHKLPMLDIEGFKYFFDNSNMQ